MIGGFFAVFEVLRAAIKPFAITYRFEFRNMQAALLATHHVGGGCGIRLRCRGFGATQIMFDDAISQPNGQYKNEEAEEIHKSPF